MAPSSIPADRDPSTEPTSVHVSAGGLRLALAWDVLLEVGEAGPLTPVPGAQPWLAGLAQWRGRLITVVDAGRLFGREPSSCRALVALRGLPCEVALGVDELLGRAGDEEPADVRLDAAALAAHAAFQPGAAVRAPGGAG
jgi:twitching motility protein PilI